MKIHHASLTVGFVFDIKESVYVLIKSQEVLVTLPLQKQVLIAKEILEEGVPLTTEIGSVLFGIYDKPKVYLIAYDTRLDAYVVSVGTREAFEMISSEMESGQKYLEGLVVALDEQLPRTSETTKLVNGLFTEEMLATLMLLVAQLKAGTSNIDYEKIVKELDHVEYPKFGV